ncbi:MAG: hypothetical protein K2Y71_05545 [Xanthobacteraceae bacterium]|nr:hypothetical protein [Xanthobacteraceae bacterium]
MATANAATITVSHVGNGSALIVVEGDFEPGDVDAFRAKVAALTTPRAAVAFRSDGGSLVAGIRIGTLIREKKFSTIIPDHGSCASACGLAWLGGTKRFMGEGASVGFHAAYILKSYGPVESSSGNAILGAYLNQLGMSEEAILYITQAAPTSIQWMNMDDAGKYGIAVAPLSPPQTTAVANAEQRDANAERRATDFVRGLLAHWSKPTAEGLPAMEPLYAETVVYHGKSTPRQEVLSSKRYLASRWTDRTYSVYPNTLSASCAKAGDTCRVKGVMSFKLYNAKTSRRSRGIASFEYRVALAGETPQVVAEARTVQEHQQSAASRLQQAQRDLQKLLAKVSKLIP